jgi:hypothetical protein
VLSSLQCNAASGVWDVKFRGRTSGIASLKMMRVRRLSMLKIQDEGEGLIEDTFEAAPYRARVEVTGRQLIRLGLSF